MAVPTSITELSTTAGSNSPAGSEAIGTNADNYLRAIQSILKTVISQGSAITAASTITPGDGNYFEVTGSTGISTIASTNSWNGREIVLKFSSTPTLTHSVSLILPGAANITAAAGDVASFVQESSGVWRCASYQRGDGSALAGAFLNEASPVIASGALTFADSTQVASGSSLFYMPIIINHDGMINQRAAASNADDTYGFDRWNILTQTGTIAVSQLTDAANGTPYMMRHTQSQASAQRFGTIQIIESANSKRLRGKSVTLGVKHKISSNANIRIALLEWTGTADTVTSDVVNDWTSSTYTAGNFFLGSNLTVTSASSAVASTGTLDTDVLTATVGSSVNNLIVMVWTESTTAQNVTLDLAVDMKIGTYDAAGYVFPVRSVVDELAMCQRYYEKSYDQSVAPGTSSSSGTVSGKVSSNTIPTSETYGTVKFAVNKRSSPTVTIYGYAGTSGTVSNTSGTDLAASSGSVVYVNESSFTARNQAAAQTTTLNGVIYHWTAQSEL